MSQLQIVLYRSRQKAEESSTETSPSAPRKEQCISWNVPKEIEFGTMMNALPTATVTEGNQAAAPMYTPPLNDRRPGFGDHTLTVTVPGNDEYNEARLVQPLHVKRAKLTVEAPRLTVEVGKPVPTLTPTVTGKAVPPDVVDVTLPHAVPPTPPVNMNGYPFMPVVQVSSGLAENYEITVKPGFLKVRPTDAQMEKNVGDFRRRTLKLDKSLQGPLLEILDKIEKKRIKLKQDALADLLQQLEMDLIEGEYVKVTGLTIAPADGAAINKEHESVQFTATVTPQDAKQPGVRWSVDDPTLATITPDGGLLTRVGKAGGPVVVTATSLCRDALIASATVDIKPRPQSIRVTNAPVNVFLNSMVTLTAVVDPPDADPGLTWKLISKVIKNVSTTREGQVKVDEPTRAGGSAKGTITMQASSEADPTVFEQVTFTFGGFGAKSVDTKAEPGRVVNVGESVTIAARVNPPEAAQDVEWKLDDPSMADMTVEGQKITLRTKAGGPVKVTCKTKDGSNVERDYTVTAKVAATGFSTNCPKTAIDIIDTLQFSPVFQPPEAKARVEWSVAPDGIATIDNAGKLTPRNSGTVTVTAKLLGTSFSDVKTITITASPTSPIGLDHWDILLPRIDAYAEKLCIMQHHLTKPEYKKWKDDLRGAMEKSGTTKTLAQMKTELLALRNERYKYSHSNWLSKAGFAAGKNCFIRNDGRMPHGTHNFRVHMTMFPTADQFSIGTSLTDLTNSVYRRNVTGFVSMHATLYVAEDNTDEQVKTYASGEDYTTKYSFVQKWALNGITYLLVKDDLSDWMGDIQDEATNALKAVYDQVHANDNGTIA
jgi:uncharacterized protein YjdB